MIIPGILEKSLSEITRKISLVENVSETIQIDLADGVLVDGESFLDVKKIDALESKVNIEIHLMVKNPLSYIDYSMTSIRKFILQVEADNVKESLRLAEQLGFDLGISISPDTPNHELEPFIHLVDYVQFMGVVPGAQGRPFEPKILEKIKEFRLRHQEVPMQVDGHMNKETIELVKPLGVTHFVVGSAIFNSSNPAAKKEGLELLLN